MSLVLSTSNNEDNTRRSSFRAERRPWMLQDYLRDDVNSCSSNGFKSFPRRECCAAAVKNIIRSSKPAAKPIARRKRISSALCRASMAVINAVKILPFTTAEPKRILPRSFSKKLFSRSFWSKKPSRAERVRKTDVAIGKYDDEIERWISSGIVRSEKYQPSDLSNDTTVTKSFTTGRNSNSTSDGKSDSSWSDITFTNSDYNYLSNSSENDAVGKNDKSKLKDEVEGEEVSERGGAIARKESGKENVSPNKKEQYSPISVMDFPDNDEGTYSPFTIRPTRFKGNRERLTKRLERSETLSGLDFEPINLATLLCSTTMKDSSPELSIQSSSTPNFIISSDSEEEEEETEDENSWINVEEDKNAERLLKIVKAEIPTDKYELDIVLIDYFRQNIIEKEDDDALVKVAKDWLNGHYDGLILGWEVKVNREAYIRDMEESGRWPTETKLQKAKVVNELQDLVFAHLIEEVLFEFCSR